MATDNTTGYPGDGDKTIFIPKPGGRGPAAKAPMPPPMPSPSFNQPEQDEFITAGVNPLVSAAGVLIALPGQLLAMVSHHDVAGLRNQVLDEIKAFETKARMLGIDTNVANTSRYVLCAFIDEAVLTTIWGSSSPWTMQSLLSTLYNDPTGGETFFAILDNLLKDPQPNLDLLELMYLCISLGFKGRYAVMERGQEKLEEVRNTVFEYIRRRRGEFPIDLSPHWQSQSNQRKALRNYVPLWVVAAVAGVLLLVIFIGFTMVLDERTDPVLEALQAVGQPTATELIDDN